MFLFLHSLFCYSKNINYFKLLNVKLIYCSNSVFCRKRKFAQKICTQMIYYNKLQYIKKAWYTYQCKLIFIFTCKTERVKILILIDTINWLLIETIKINWFKFFLLSFKSKRLFWYLIMYISQVLLNLVLEITFYEEHRKNCLYWILKYYFYCCY